MNNKSKFFLLLGPSCTGKDTLLRELIARVPKLTRLVTFTTRPKRDGEQDGVDYNFVTCGDFIHGKVIEKREYNTIERGRKGVWTYGLIDVGQFSDNHVYVAAVTPDAVARYKEYFGAENVCSVLISVPDRVRFERALKRENEQKVPNYDELARRWLADKKDFEMTVTDFRVVNLIKEDAINHLCELAKSFADK